MLLCGHKAKQQFLLDEQNVRTIGYFGIPENIPEKIPANSSEETRVFYLRL